MTLPQRMWLDLDPVSETAWRRLLTQSGLHPDLQVDYTVGVFEGGRLVATGSLLGNIIKEVAVSPQSQGGNLLSSVVQALLDRLAEQGLTHSFVYTKPETAGFFRSLGFRQVAGTDKAVLLEQGYPNIQDYLRSLDERRLPGSDAAAIVMKADPPTLGHAYLIERAAHANDALYVFVLSSRDTLLPAQERMRLVSRMCRDRPGVSVLPTGDYLVSAATFPSYFLKDKARGEVAREQARLDATIFRDLIAPALSISHRYVGQEPYSAVTALYNEELGRVLQGSPELVVLPRLAVGGVPVSASQARQALADGNRDKLQSLVCPGLADEIWRCARPGQDGKEADDAKNA
ncbi:citrate lyase ligase [Bifidobacterium actinocoloniiforme DSM 22766]|uniref:Citrate lyase ligase n=1 Tax=Bifidobacterium actinocoloniiforme DSM 22766 TaxID=1437605 RepID=A0A086YYN2_9BIFI|nr:adenylyltransferase/cytidyltransferase family protein [Bifidobacterium actinocoloniiforme]AKV55905.1 [citrate [pro-3S]-lyase] ligase [Bifidobacterium actinocoloniiforme DSM 22766]KFI39382.1 citrate lyase ligase [Bifidobacterium actinocoloniiforme DSM 22766]